MTIRDIAKMAGVSVGTVSNVLNHPGKVAPETEDRVWRVINEVNYVPNVMAKNLKLNNSRNICVIAEDVSAMPDPVIIDGICDYCSKMNYSVTLYNLRLNSVVKDFHYEKYVKTSEYEKKLKDIIVQVKALNVCGIIYMAVYPRNIENTFPDLDIPVTFCYSYSSSNDYCVNCDDFYGAKQAVEYMISLNHRKIALICGAFDTLPTHKRLQGYQAALMENELLYISKYVKRGDWQFERSYETCIELLALPDPPTAIFAMSDYMAYGAMNAAMDCGRRIPQDLSIHGFDGYEFSRFIRPTLTTIAMPLTEIGKQSAKLLLGLVEKNIPEHNSILLSCEHVIRESVADLQK